MKARILAVAATLAALSACAQPYDRPGPGPGAGPGPGMGPGQGMGPGYGMHRGPRYGADVTPGWALMTPQERAEHQSRMRSFQDYDECQAYLAQHHARMQSRAQEQGTQLPFAGPGRGCDYLRK